MEVITESGIISVCSMIITFIFGELSKRFNFLESRYIPLQNLLIGLLSGIICYIANLSDDVIASIISCLIGAMAAGGAYDVSKTRRVIANEYCQIFKIHRW